MISVKTKLSSIFKRNKAIGIIRQEFKKGMTQVVSHLESKVKEDMPVGVTGMARIGVTGQVINPFHGRVGEQGPAVKYIDIIEKGRRPGSRFPPPDAIMLWLRRTDKGRKYVASIKAKFGIKSDASALRQATFLKSRAIARQGIKGKRIFEKTEQREKRRVNRFFQQAARRAERRLSSL